MKKDIILSGVGGQGILSIATVIGKAALKDGLYMKQAEVHGMSQRGGDVQSNLRISDQPIASDLIPSGKCDLIISLEPMEGLRYLPTSAPKLVGDQRNTVRQHPQLSRTGRRTGRNRQTPPQSSAQCRQSSQRSRLGTRSQHRIAGSHHPIPGHRLPENTRQHS